MRHSYRCHLAPDALPDFPVNEATGRLRAEPEDVLGVARCPCCRTPMIARMGRHGPYLHCRCYEQEKLQRGQEENPTMQID